MAFDLDALARETEGEPFTFTFGGDEYELPAQPDVRAITAASAGRVEEMLERLLGADQWARLQASPALLTQEMFKGLLTAYGEHLGIDVGNLSASPSFYRSTVAPSKRTSRASTRSH
jgi:hypothetical protein